MSLGGSPSTEAQETARLEAFSDGVFAIAITLLVLDLKVPHDITDGRPLLRALLNLWPSYFAFVTSFATIGIMWINHHRLFMLIRRSDDALLVFNGLLLLGVTFVPFPTAVLAEYIRGDAQHIAAAFYSGTYVGLAIVFNLLWRHAARGNRLLGHRVDPHLVEAITRGYSFGPLLYVLAFVLAFVSAEASAAMNLGLAVFWALPSQNPLVQRKTRG